MSHKTILQGLFIVWALWHLLFGLLSTFLPELGAQISGWRPQDEWDADLLSLSTQYGMAMLLLGLVFVISAIDPIRYFRILWIAIAELILGIGYAFYIYLTIGGITISQVSIQGLINVIFIGVFLFLSSRLKNSASHSN